MGSNKSKALTPQELQNQEIERQLAAEQEARLRRFKILLLGAGESGKSTILKQVKHIYKIPLKEVEIASIKQTIKFNTMQSMNILISVLADNNIPVDSKTARLIQSFVKTDNYGMTEKTAALITKLWSRKCIQEAWAMRATFWYLDAAEYYFEHVERFAEPEYTPTTEDIIMARVRTTGINVTEFKEGGCDYSIVDVGGQRNERRKWINCFDDVHTVLFVVSLIGYNQVMFEDPSRLRLLESLTLFEEMVANKAFVGTSFVLALNKKDVFEEMLREAPLSQCFGEFREIENAGHPHTKVAQLAIQFIQKKFEDAFHRDSCTPVSQRAFETHVIAARYSKDVKYLVEDIHQFVTGKRKLTKTRISSERFIKAADAESSSSKATSSKSSSSLTPSKKSVATESSERRRKKKSSAPAVTDESDTCDPGDSPTSTIKPTKSKKKSSRRTK